MYVVVHQALDLATSKMPLKRKRSHGEEEEPTSPNIPPTRKLRSGKARAVKAVDEEEPASSKIPPTRKPRRGKARAVKDVEEEEEEEEEPVSIERAQKRTKQERPADIIDDMEDIMSRLERLPPEFRLGRGTFNIPRNLLKAGTSTSTLDTQLKKFKTQCEEGLQLVTAQLEETQGVHIDRGQLIFQSVARISS